MITHNLGRILADTLEQEEIVHRVWTLRIRSGFQCKSYGDHPIHNVFSMGFRYSFSASRI